MKDAGLLTAIVSGLAWLWYISGASRYSWVYAFLQKIAHFVQYVFGLFS